ncbi:hypothetical protein INT45_007289 [Circinella minor]|uniref:Uncharacterized protein n=1 Tax=Circinella minor TaxID=1195481 RepID=A0A8H7S8S1_9FUNG|nr:hypothetical protein INT45_007289 [Circinella minor]
MITETTTDITGSTPISVTTFQQVTEALNFCERAITKQRVKFQQIITEGQQCISQKNIQNQQLQNELKLVKSQNSELVAQQAYNEQRQTEIQFLKQTNSQLQNEIALQKEQINNKQKNNEQLYTEINMLRKANEHLKAENGVLGQANERFQNKYAEWEHVQHFKTLYFQLSQMIVNTLGLTTTTTPTHISASVKEQERLLLPSPSLSITSNHSDEGCNTYFSIDIHDMEDQIKNQQKKNNKIIKDLIDMQFELGQVKQELLQERENIRNFTQHHHITTKSLQSQLDLAMETCTTLTTQNTNLHDKMNELKLKLDKAIKENQEKSKFQKKQQEEIGRQDQVMCNLKAENQKIIIEYELTKVALESTEKDLYELQSRFDELYYKYYNEYQQYQQNYGYYQQYSKQEKH